LLRAADAVVGDDDDHRSALTHDLLHGDYEIAAC
jgi:hypothetical protein